MFSTSSQRRDWMFANQEEVMARRRKVHDQYWETWAGKVKEELLNFDEEQALRVFYERKLVEFCVKFAPPMPKCVLGTAVHYMKRFYLNNSVMDYHPKEIL